MVDGVEKGMSQYSTPTVTPRQTSTIVWNFPLEATFKSTNPFGWPQVVVSVYGVDWLGNDVIVGYGSTRLPTKAGRYESLFFLFLCLASNSLSLSFLFFYQL
jgi:B9 domain-containing protein 1